MNDAHIREMKIAVCGYNEKVVAAHEKIELNGARYREEIAAEENAKVRKQLKAARQSAEDAIRAAADDKDAEADAYVRYANIALDLVARLDQENTLGGGPDSPMLQAAIASFGEPGAFNERMFDLLQRRKTHVFQKEKNKN